MATSLAAVVLAAGGAAAQSPPAGTNWKPYPTTQTGTVTPLPSAAVPPANTKTFTPPPAPTSPGVIGSRVVMYSKPSGEIRPVQGAEPAQKPTTDPKQAADANSAPDAKSDTSSGQRALSPIFTNPDKAKVFSLPTDDELFAERVFDERKESIASKVQKQNKDEQAKYKEKLEEYQKNPSKERPIAPPRIEDFGVNVNGMALSERMATKFGYMPGRTLLEPGYVVHRRLLFEEKNSERYGWELGMLQPFLSAGYFYKDVLLWPAHLMSTRERYDVSAGKCPAGSPVPYYLYPPQVTIRGGIWEAAAVVGVIMLLP